MSSQNQMIEKFMDDPVVEYELERVEENTELRDSLTSIGQANEAL